MKLRQPVVNYREFRLNKLNSNEFSHLKLLLYWPIYGLMFLFVERIYPANHYYPVHCPLDDFIPFCEYFLIPYLLWFAALAFMVFYTMLYDLKAFRRYMKFIILTCSAAIAIYLIWPTCQELRPQSFARDNIFTRFISGLYNFDTHTNVCPSLHVIGAFAVMFTAWHIDHFRRWREKAFFTVLCVLICASTVFLKQHSVYDVLAAIPICIIGYALFFRKATK